MYSLLYVRNLCHFKNKIRAYRGIFFTDGQINSGHITKREKHHLIQLNPSENFEKGSRAFSSFNYSDYSAALTDRLKLSEIEKSEFMGAFSDVVKDLAEYVNRHDKCGAAKWYEKVLQYNVAYDMEGRGLLTVITYKNLVGDNQLTPEKIKSAQYLGWCIEMLVSSYNLMDDIVDGSITRYGQPCWHTLDNIGMIAINDAFSIENGLFYILKKYFGQRDYYLKLIELMHDVSFLTALGQISDLQMSKRNVTTFTMEKYKNIALNKAAQCSFFLPVASAMHLAGITDPELFKMAKTILIEIGNFFQVQNDFIDFYGNPEITGKVGTDIRNNKCTWLAVTCMERASESQKDIMRDCYGKNDPEKVTQVKKLYMELEIPNLYARYEKDTFNRIKELIKQVPAEVPLFKFWYDFFDKNM